MAEDRAHRMWWLVNDGQVLEAEGWACSPPSADYWWFPSVGFSAREGFHVFPTRDAAVVAARRELERRAADIARKIAALEETLVADKLTPQHGDPARGGTLMAGHTPGPWTLQTVKTSIGVCYKIGPFPGSRIHPVSYACVYEDGLHLLARPQKTELLANAQLIAAAPDLLAALRALVTQWEETFDVEMEDLDASNALDRARAAIAKAEERE